MRITWEVEDGYAGKSRPHFINIPDEEIEKCKTLEEKNEFIYQCIQDEFDQTISFCITNREES